MKKKEKELAAKMTRKQAREQAFLVVFQSIFLKSIAISELLKKNEDEDRITHHEFTCELCEILDKNLKEIDSLIAKLSSKWEINRISKVAVSALRLAISELNYIENIPEKVAINEAIELTKKFATDQDASFVNGVLGGIILERKQLPKSN